VHAAWNAWAVAVAVAGSEPACGRQVVQEEAAEARGGGGEWVMMRCGCARDRAQVTDGRFRRRTSPKSGSNDEKAKASEGPKGHSETARKRPGDAF
jgi:hypothetical protein